MNRVLIVGASVAGVTAAEALREEGYRGEIVLAGEEIWEPYSRPPLSKQVLSDADYDPTIRRAEELADLGIDLRLGWRATWLDVPHQQVRFRNAVLGYDSLVIATGARARALPGDAMTLRTLSDARAIRAQLRSSPHTAIIGGGILGCELASAAAAAGSEVTLYVRQRRLEIHGFGEFLSSRVQLLLLHEGVRLETSSDVLEVSGTDVHLKDGAIRRVGLVIAAIGAEPAVEWLHGSGLGIHNGAVKCDADGMASPGIWAIGDVAAWQAAPSVTATRLEHQQSAIDQARHVARVIARGQREPLPAPFFWSSLFGTRILVAGRIPWSAEIQVLHGDAEGDRFVAEMTSDGRTVGLVGWNMPREFRLSRASIDLSEGEHHERMPVPHG